MIDKQVIEDMVRIWRASMVVRFHAVFSHPEFYDDVGSRAYIESEQSITSCVLNTQYAMISFYNERIKGHGIMPYEHNEYFGVRELEDSFAEVIMDAGELILHELNRRRGLS